jgi:hypothetical protein
LMLRWSASAASWTFDSRLTGSRNVKVFRGSLDALRGTPR